MLQIANLEVVYHSVVRVLSGVSLAVPQGQVVALLGPNGAGKTTTLRAITGLLAIHEGRVTRGDIRLEGADLGALTPPQVVARGVAQVMEGRRIFADLTVEENLMTGAWGRSDRGGIRQDLEQFYARFPVLGDRRRGQAGYLSGGEQQMLAIARALMSRPRLLLLDEPSLGLAPRIVLEVAQLVQELKAGGMSILLVEQNASVALEVADYGYVMENGRVVMDGDAASLKGDPDIQEFYLGVGHAGRKSYRDVKLYRRRKRWLS